MCFQIAVRNWKKQPGPITKSKLTHEIAKRVQQYLDKFAVSYHISLILLVLMSETRRPRWTGLAMLGGRLDRVA